MSGPFGAGALNFFSGAAEFYSHTIDQSVRFNDNDSAYLSKLWGSAGNRQTFTYSFWIKRANIGSRMDFISFQQDVPIIFNSDTIRVFLFGADRLITSAQFRDVSAWYHIVLTVDSTDATSGDRIKLYVNGERQTDFSTESYPSLNANANIYTGGLNQYIGRLYGGSNYFDGYVADMYYLDGIAADASSFGETKAGIWIPKEYTGSYGTNGFKLAFQDSASLGDDTSGNGNDFTANNLAATDQLPDSPTNSFATFNPLLFNTTPTLQEGNLEASLTSGAGQANRSRLGSTFSVTSGKWYWELTLPGTGDYVGFGISRSGFRYMLHTDPTEGVGFASFQTQATAAVTHFAKDSTGTTATTTTGPTVTNIIQIALDADDGKMWIGDGTNWYSGDGSGDITGTSGDPAAGTNASFTGLDFSEAWTPMIEMTGANETESFLINFGQDSSFTGTETAQGNSDGNGKGDFYYSPPSGFLALCAANLPAPGIDPAADEAPTDYFNTVLYTGTGATQSITGVGFQPDWVWLKTRSGTTNHQLFDSVRGVNKSLVSNATGAEDTSSTNKLTSFDSDGFSLGDHATPNTSSSTYVAWSWKAGGTAVSNTDGSITSSVSASPESGFSVVTYSGTSNSNATVGHGLGVAPTMVIVKPRTEARNWLIWHTAFNDNDKALLFDDEVPADNRFGPNAPTASVFGVYGGQGNRTGTDFVAYCFTDIDGMVKAGSYVGNGSSDGPMVFTGFRPAFVMFKNITTIGGHWVIYDAVRDTFNPVDSWLNPNRSNAEGTDSVFDVDFVSNGFKVRNTDIAWNTSGDTFIYLAFAEQPFKYANAR